MSTIPFISFAVGLTVAASCKDSEDAVPCEDVAQCLTGQLCLAGICVTDEDSTPGLSKEAREELGEQEGLGGAEEPTDYGAPIDEFCGIAASDAITTTLLATCPRRCIWRSDARSASLFVHSRV